MLYVCVSNVTEPLKVAESVAVPSYVLVAGATVIAVVNDGVGSGAARAVAGRAKVVTIARPLIKVASGAAARRAKLQKCELVISIVMKVINDPS